MSNTGVGIGTVGYGAGLDLSGVYQTRSEKSAADGYASLDSSALVPLSELPEDSLRPAIFSAADESEQLLLSVKRGDYCQRTDENLVYVALNADNASLADWLSLLTPDGLVVSVDGQTGVVDLSGEYAALSHSHDPADINETTEDQFVSQTQIDDWDSKANSSEVAPLIHYHDPADINETTDDQFVSQTQIDEWDGKANLSDVVTLTGDQNIAGEKTFDDLIAASMAIDEGEIVDQENVGSIAHIFMGSLEWQSFTAGETGLLVALTTNHDGSFSGDLTIYEDEGTGGTELTTQSVSVAVGINKTELDTPVSVVAGKQYTALFETTGAVYTRKTDGDAYPDGQASGGFDWYFQTHVRPGGKVATEGYVDEALAEVEPLTFSAPLDKTAGVVSINQVSDFTDGYMTISEHQKLEGVAENANNYVLPGSIASWQIGDISFEEHIISNDNADGSLLLALDTGVDQQFTNASTGTGAAASWQSFTPTKSILFGIQIFIQTSRTFLFRIYDGEGIGGSILYEDTSLSVPTGAQDILFDPIFLTPLSKYTIYLESVPPTFNVAWLRNTSGGYAGGRASTGATHDHYFKTYTVENFILLSQTGIKLGTIKSGATQSAAGAISGELWATDTHASLPDNVVLVGA